MDPCHPLPLHMYHSEIIILKWLWKCYWIMKTKITPVQSSGSWDNIMVAPTILQRPLRNKVQATERYIYRSNLYLFRSTRCKNGGAIILLQLGLLIIKLKMITYTFLWILTHYTENIMTYTYFTVYTLQTYFIITA